jgi:hypothetical protein
VLHAADQWGAAVAQGVEPLDVGHCHRHRQSRRPSIVWVCEAPAAHTRTPAALRPSDDGASKGGGSGAQCLKLSRLLVLGQSKQAMPAFFIII